MTRWGNAGAGVLLVARDTGRILLTLRSEYVMEPGTWGIPGGKVDDDESPRKTAVRELREELGVKAAAKDLSLLFSFIEPSFRYDTFMATIPHQKTARFKLNWESDDARWFSLSTLPSPLHFGARLMLRDPDVQQRLLAARP